MSGARPLDLRLLTSLEVLLDARSVSRAAERLSISQPAMSRMLARLRDQFDDPLLVRGRGTMVLTPRAEALRQPLKSWLTQGEVMMHPPRFDPSRLSRIFRIASTDFGLISVITPATTVIARASPGSSLSIEPMTKDSFRRLADGDLDMVVTGFAPGRPGFHRHHLFSETHLALARRGHPASLAPLTPEGLLDWPHVVALVQEGYGSGLGCYPDETDGRSIIASVTSFSSVPYLVNDSDFVAILPARLALAFARVHGHTAFALPVQPPGFDYFLTWHDRSAGDAATAWLVDVLSAPFAPAARSSERPEHLAA